MNERFNQMKIQLLDIEYAITLGNKSYTEYPESKEDGLVCGKYRLGDLIKQKGLIFRYLYDFGDSWEHELVLEENRYFNPDRERSWPALKANGPVRLKMWAAYPAILKSATP